MAEIAEFLDVKPTQQSDMPRTYEIADRYRPELHSNVNKAPPGRPHHGMADKPDTQRDRRVRVGRAGLPGSRGLSAAVPGAFAA